MVSQSWHNVVAFNSSDTRVTEARGARDIQQLTAVGLAIQHVGDWCSVIKANACLACCHQTLIIVTHLAPFVIMST